MRASSVRSLPYFSSAWNFASGFWSVTRCEPRTVGERLEHGVVGRAHRGERVARGIAFGLGQREQQVLGGDVVVLEVFGLFAGAVEHLGQRVRHARLRAAGDLGQLGDGGVRAVQQFLHADARAFEHGQHDAFAVFQQRRKQMHGQDFRIAVLSGSGRGGLDRLLRFSGQFFPFECHNSTNLRLTELSEYWMRRYRRRFSVERVKRAQGLRVWVRRATTSLGY